MLEKIVSGMLLTFGVAIASVIIPKISPEIKEFKLKKGETAVVHESIYDSQKLMIIYDGKNNEKEIFGIIGDYVTIENREIGKKYVVGKNGYFSGGHDFNEISFGDDSVSRYLKSRKALYDSLRKSKGGD
jgi:hypothetical protein